MRGEKIQSSPARSGRILVGVDGSSGSRRALAWALEEARIRDSVLEAAIAWQKDQDLRRGRAGGVGRDGLGQRARERLAAAVEQTVAEKGSVGVEQILLEGDAAEALCGRAAEADLLVVGSHGHGTFANLLLGSVSTKCAHHSPSPVVIVPSAQRSAKAQAFQISGRIVVGVDGSAGSLAALRWAVVEAGIRGSSLVALMAWRGVEADDDMVSELSNFPSIMRHDRASAEQDEQRLRGILAEVLDESSLEVEPLLLEGDPAEILCRHTAEADLLVVGARGHGTLPGLLLGSVSAKCAHHSPRPIVIVSADREVHATTAEG